MGDRTEDLVARVLAGDPLAQRELYEQLAPKVYRLVVRLVGVAEASDLSQQVFLKLFRGLGKFRGKGTLSTWVYRITVNECLQHRRRQGRRLRELPAELPDPAPSLGHRLEQAELLQQALDRLDDRLRAVFLLREVEELTYDQIAAVLALPAGTVASQLNRARAELRTFLTKVLSE